jgi:hypothetical protein
MKFARILRNSDGTDGRLKREAGTTKNNIHPQMSQIFADSGDRFVNLRSSAQSADCLSDLVIRKRINSMPVGRRIMHRRLRFGLEYKL